MIGANKEKFQAKGSLTREKVPFSDAEICCGFSLSGDTLTVRREAGAYEGAEGKYILPEGCVPEALYFLRGEGAFCAAAYAAGKMYLCLTDGGAFIETDTAFAAVPACVRVYDGEETLVLSDGQSVCLFKKTGLTACTQIPAFDCAGYAYERLWVYKKADDGRRVQFSALLDIFDFDGGGYIDLPDAKGDLLAFADVDGFFCLFREYGVQKLIVKGKEDAFALSDLYSPAAQIRKGTVCAENGRAYCLTETGLLRFAGENAEYVFRDYAPFFSGEKGKRAKAAVCGGKVYLFLEGGAKGVFAGDTVSGEGRLLKKSFSAPSLGLSPKGVALFCVAEGEICAFFAGNEAYAGEKIWKSKEIYPFGGAEGALEELIFCGKGEFVLTAASECGERSFRFISEGEHRIRTALRGSRFRYELVCVGREGRAHALTAGYSRRG